MAALLTKSTAWLTLNDISNSDIALFGNRSVSTIAHYGTGRIPVSDHIVDAVRKLAIQRGATQPEAQAIAEEYRRLCDEARRRFVEEHPKRGAA